MIAVKINGQWVENRTHADWQALEDARLDRWRYNDHIVVYKNPHGEARVVREDNGSVSEYSRRFISEPGPILSETILAARAYFDAHPEPKPAWRDAKTGEVWELTFTEAGGGSTEAWTVTRPPLRFTHPFYVSLVALNDSTIVKGRRIYPEGTE